MTRPTVYLVRSPADLGRAITGLRRSTGLSQQQLAERLGVDRSYLAKLENGHRSPLLDLIFEVLAELEATVEVSERHADRGRG